MSAVCTGAVVYVVDSLGDKWCWAACSTTAVGPQVRHCRSWLNYIRRPSTRTVCKPIGRCRIVIEPEEGNAPGDKKVRNRR